MDRRNFIGSVLGTIVATSLPFKVVEAKVERTPDALLRVKNWIRLFEMPASQLMKCRLFMETEHRIKIYCPGMKKVDRETSTKLYLHFEAVDLELSQAVRQKKLGLVDDRGIFIRSTDTQYMTYTSGDMMRATYTLNMGTP